MLHFFRHIDRGLSVWLHRFGIATLQISLGGMYVWFGALKLVGQGPMMPVLKLAYRDFPFPVSFQVFATTLGIVELAVGITLLLPLVSSLRRIERACVRVLFALLFFQVFLTLAIALFSPAVFFYPYAPFVTVLGEFFIKHLVFLIVAVVVAAHLREDPW